MAAILLMSNGASAADAIRWSSDFRQACDVAAQQKRLVLLHFYSDNCPPCVRFDKEVFSQPQVGEVLERYCVPMKVHVEQTPDLARKYNIQRWPTDVLVTPAGMEVYRSVGFRSATEYLTMVEQVALHAGARPAAGGQVPIAAAAPTQSSQYPGPYQGGPIAGSFQSQLPANDRTPYQMSIGPATHQNIDTSRQPRVATSGQPGGEAPDVAPVGNPMGPMTPPAQPQADASGGRSPYLQTQTQSQPQMPPTPPADESTYQNVAASGYGQPQAGAGYGATTGAQYAANPPMAPPPQPVVNRYAQQPGVAPDVGPAPYTPPQQFAQTPPAGSPPWGHGAAAAQAPSASVAPAASAGPYSMQPPFAAAAPSNVAPAMAAVAPPPATMVPSAKAPPVVLDGCCAVTMVETRKLKKADAQFGAVHRGRTYLFISAAEQTKFLADPDRYAVILSGFDPVRFAKSGEMVEGKREFGMMYQQKIYLMADEESLNQFSASPQFFSTSAHQAMLRSETSGAQFR